MNAALFRLVVGLVVVAGGATIRQANGQNGSTSSGLEVPFLARANGQIIDTGSAWGHSSPCVADLDADDLDDLIVGDFGGKFRVYFNVGTAESPSYKEGGYLQAGGVDAHVRIYCCIGAQARFCDLDGDGILDMIANSYDPGHCYLFPGRPNNEFAARQELLDKAGVPIRSAPVQSQNYQSFGSFYEAVDWENDGDFDLIIGCFNGELKLRINEGAVNDPVFAAENIEIKAAGQPLKVKAHLCPVVADWDQDGLWDIIAGSDDGSVTFFRNVGDKTSPVFAAGQTLVEAPDGNGYERIMWSDSDVVPGIRSQVEVTDYNGDGQMDLLVGDFYTAYEFQSNLSAQQKQEVETLIAENESRRKPFMESMEVLRKDFAARYPGDEIFSDQADKEWSEAYQALRESPEAKQMEVSEKKLVEGLRPFLARTSNDGDRAFDLAKSHGHVWVYLRK